METSARIAREIRVSRIQRIFARCVEQYRQALFAATLANDRLDQIHPKHPDWLVLRATQKKSIAQMDRWNKRCHCLARAEVDTILRPVEGLK